MRFATDEFKNVDSFTFLAFSAGPRYFILRYFDAIRILTLEIVLVNVLLFIS